MLEFHGFRSSHMLGRLRLWASFVSCDEGRCGVHDCTTVCIVAMRMSWPGQSKNETCQRASFGIHIQDTRMGGFPPYPNGTIGSSKVEGRRGFRTCRCGIQRFEDLNRTRPGSLASSASRYRAEVVPPSNSQGGPSSAVARAVMQGRVGLPRRLESATYIGER